MGVGAASIKKTIYYMRRNGFKGALYAIGERLKEGRKAPYVFVPVSEEELAAKREEAKSCKLRFSIVVPTYCTGEEHLRAMIDSVRAQVYENWELILADATPDDSVAAIVTTYEDDRIRYVRLRENGGISQNTNQGIADATGEYIGLLDHDDVLTPDALCEMLFAIVRGQEQGAAPKLLYSDEDKCNGNQSSYFEPHYKEDFNLDMLLSNNYICHFCVMEAQLMKKLCFRSEYDGAQDYDLVLRAVEELLPNPNQIVHIDKILYHWRCHENSTAQNPQSKQYAYEAGLRAVQDFADRQHWAAKAVHLKHLGFYRLQYKDNPFTVRPSIGAIGGRVLHHRKIVGGRMNREGKVFYQGLHQEYSGYVHRAALQQDADVIDIRCMKVNVSCVELFEKVTGVSYVEEHSVGLFDCSCLPEGTDYAEVSLRFCKALQDENYMILWDPQIIKRV